MDWTNGLVKQAFSLHVLLELLAIAIGIAEGILVGLTGSSMMRKKRPSFFVGVLHSLLRKFR
jgi:hypothetical protein